MSQTKTVGQAVAFSVKKSAEEMEVVRQLLKADLPLPGNVHLFDEIRKHMAEAIDAILYSAGSIGGEDSKRDVLQKILSRHNIEIK